MALKLLSDGRLITRTSLALLLANVRYWSSVAPIVRDELKRWQLRAAAIEDAELRALAYAKLRQESFHADAAAMFATLVPRAHRRSVVEAIVALELLFDYLDGLSERPSSDPLREGERLFSTLIDAVAPALSGSSGRSQQDADSSQDEDSSYTEMLSRTVALAISRLPAASAIAATASRTASRSAQAQTRIHAVPQIGGAQLEAWARSEPQTSEVGWRELVAGAGSSVLVLHALIAAAADPHMTDVQAVEIEAAYLSTCVLLTLLDGLVDYEQDKGNGCSQGSGYIGLYRDREGLPELLCQSARRAVLQARALPNGPHHVMLLTGVVAYYSTAPGARTEIAKPAVAQLRCELAPLISPTLAVMRTWRSVRRRVSTPLPAGRPTEVNMSPLENREEVIMQLTAHATEVTQGMRTRRQRSVLRWLALTLGALALGATPVAWGHNPRAHAARTLNVNDDGRLHYVKSSGSVIIDEGRTSGTFPGWVKVRFIYDGAPTVSASITISGGGGSISAHGSARLSSPTSPAPSFTGEMTITGGTGRYAHVRGAGRLYGVYNRRSYGLTVQAIGKLPY